MSQVMQESRRYPEDLGEAERYGRLSEDLGALLGRLTALELDVERRRDELAATGVDQFAAAALGGKMRGLHDARQQIHQLMYKARLTDEAWGPRHP